MSECEPTYINTIVTTLNLKGYPVFTEQNRLNIVGVRSAFASTNKFDDKLVIFWKEGNNWKGFSMDATTDPGQTFLQNPMSTKGTAILVGGSYDYTVGTHTGRTSSYTALVQNGPVTVIRDTDRNSIINWMANKETGWYGINIHRSSGTGTAINVNDYSAGCQVVANIDDFNFLMHKAILSENMYGKGSLKYNLIDNSMIKGQVVTIGALAVATLLYFKLK